MVSLICYVDELQPLTLRLLVMCKHEINACFCFFYSQLDSRIHVPQCILTGTRLMAHLFLEFQERLPENMLTGCPVRTGLDVLKPGVTSRPLTPGGHCHLQLLSCQWCLDSGGGLGGKGEGIGTYTLVVTKRSQGWRAQHRKWSQSYCSNYVWCQVGA